LGREGTFECLELPGGKRPLLGVIPLEAMGIEPDLRSQSLRLLPLTEQDTYLTIL
ncbi:MAG: aspartyl protease, partial [Blastocatellia bacterium]